MSAAQIIAELPGLTLAERDAVELHLLKLKARRASDTLKANQKEWAKELDDLAETSRRVATGKKGSSIADIINDIRDGR
jgi:hypothetical protein